MPVLIVCEKNIAAERIARILSSGTYKRNYLGRTAVYNFDSGGEQYAVVGLRGHILNLDYPQEYNKWDLSNLREVLNAKPVKQVVEWSIARALSDIAPNASEVIIATDFDREGELIGVEALSLVVKSNPSIKIKRARFSAITEEEVRKTFANPVEVDYNLAYAAEARQTLDLVWGTILTRFLSLSSKQTGREFLSAGRVQSPTLRILVDREKEIQNFVPKPYWLIDANLRKGEAKAENREQRIANPSLESRISNSEFRARHEKGQIWDKPELDAIMAKLAGADKGTVSDYKCEQKRETPPSPFNTTSYLQAATALGLSAHRAMSIAEELYMSGYISYPRTDNTVYPKSLGIYSILRKLTKSAAFGKEAEELLENHRPYPTRGRMEATDHPPIHPVDVANKEKMPKEAWAVYELVVRRFFATMAPDGTAEESEARISISGEPFKAEGYRIIEQGWRKYYPYFRVNEHILPMFSPGETVDVLLVEQSEEKTKPLKRYSQGSLIQEMERLGLGTKSTRAEIIQKLYDRGYVEGGNVIPTKAGIAVTDALKEYSSPIVSPEMTARLEEGMDEIANGAKKIDDIVSVSSAELSTILEELQKNEKEIGEKIQKILREQNAMGNCPNCGAPLRMLHSRYGKRFVGCSAYPKCSTTYPLPQKGKIEYTGVCPECKAPTVKVIMKGMRPWHICINMNCPTTKARMEARAAKFAVANEKKEKKNSSKKPGAAAIIAEAEKKPTKKKKPSAAVASKPKAVEKRKRKTAANVEESEANKP